MFIDNFLAFVGSQAKKEKEIQKALESLEHYKSLHAETEATNALLLEQLSTLKQGIFRFSRVGFCEVKKTNFF